jgi:hypothetical protein
MNSIEKAAHAYRDLGFSVMPVGDDKLPAVKWKWLQDMRPTHEDIREWWDRYPHANVGIVTGEVSGIIVLDLDSRGAKDYAKDKGIPVTPISRTSKGNHVLFDFPRDLVGNKSDQKLGMDIRGEGGYIVAPPSVHETGVRYEWTKWHPWNTKLATMPEWLIDWCNNTYNSGGQRDKGWQFEVLAGVSEGGRNHAAASLAGRFLNKDLSEDEILEILIMWNERNSPPLSLYELERTLNSIANRHRRNR